MQNNTVIDLYFTVISIHFNVFLCNFYDNMRVIREIEFFKRYLQKQYLRIYYI